MPRSASYSPDDDGSPRRERSPYERTSRREENTEVRTSLLVRNIPRDARPEDLREPFEKYGQVKDVYLPRDYYTQEPRGFGFVQFLSGEHAKAAQRAMDRTMISGREITVVFAEENRKRPQDMRGRERVPRGRYGGGGGYTGRRRSPPYSYRSRSYSRSPPMRGRSPSPRRSSRYRSPSPPPYGGSPPPRGRRSPPYSGDRSPPPHRGERGSYRGGRSPPPHQGDRSPPPYRRHASPPPHGVLSRMGERDVLPVYPNEPPPRGYSQRGSQWQGGAPRGRSPPPYYD